MTSRKKWWIGVLAGTLVTGSVAYINRVEIALGLVGFAVDRRTVVGPTQDITWQTGVDPQGRAPDERPPNIVLILADDLGWNDLTINDGVAGGTVPTPHIDSIAHQGVNFTNGYAASGLYLPEDHPEVVKRQAGLRPCRSLPVGCDALCRQLQHGGQGQSQQLRT